MILPDRVTFRAEPLREREATARLADHLRFAESCRERQGDQRRHPDTRSSHVRISQVAPTCRHEPATEDVLQS